MKKILFLSVMLISSAMSLKAQTNQMTEDNTIYVNQDITTVLLFPEKINMVDLSTDKIAGNQSDKNILRIKPKESAMQGDFMGTVTLIGEKNIKYYNMVYCDDPQKCTTLKTVEPNELQFYSNKNTTMSESVMADMAWSVANTKRKFHHVTAEKYGVKAWVNNIYTVNDYFFIDFSLKNKTNIKYDVDEIRLKLTDKKQKKNVNEQTVELYPVFMLNEAHSFSRNYKNVIVINKLTFPEDKILQLEIYENQISGRVITVQIEYSDILNADAFDDTMINNNGSKNLYRQRYNTLKEENKVLKSDLKEAQEALLYSREQYENGEIPGIDKSEIEDLQKANEDKLSELENLRRDNEEIQASFDALKDSNKELTKENIILREQNEDLQKINDKLTGEKEKLQKKIDKFTEAFND